MIKKPSEYAQVCCPIYVKKIGLDYMGVTKWALKWPKMPFLLYFCRNQKYICIIVIYNHKKKPQ